MDISDIKKAKSEAEKQIVTILKELEAKTRLDIETVTFEKSGLVRGYSTPEIKKVEIKLIV